MNEPRTYRQAPFQFVILLLVALIFAGVLFPTFREGDAVSVLLFGSLIGLFLLFSLYSLTGAIMVSDAEIASRRLWMTRSLGWNEIHQVSGSGSGLKLKNYDGDITVSLSSQVPGFEEVVEQIGQKRPDLFTSPDLYVMERNLLSMILRVLFGLVIIGMGVWIISQNGEVWFPAIFFLAAGLITMVTVFASVQTVSIEGGSLLVKYLFKEMTYRADQIEAVRLDFQRTRNGRIYFVQLQLQDRKTVRIANLRPGTAIAYLVIREWHRKHARGRERAAVAGEQG